MSPEKQGPSQEQMDEVYERSIGDQVRLDSSRTPEERAADQERDIMVARMEEADFSVIHPEAPQEEDSEK